MYIYIYTYIYINIYIFSLAARSLFWEPGSCEGGSGLKVPCAPTCFDFKFPVIKTTKLSVETRSGT